MLKSISNLKFNTLYFKGNRQNDYSSKIEEKNDTFESSNNMEAAIDDAISKMLLRGFDIGDVAAFKRKTKLEIDLEYFFRLFNDKEIIALIKKANFQGLSFDELCNMAFNSVPLCDSDEVLRVLKEAGIDSVSQLDKFIKLAYKNITSGKSLSYQCEEALYIWKHLDNKEDLANYFEILIDLYKDEEYSSNPDYSILNKYCEFLKNEGVHNFNQLDSFAHLKEYYDDFESEQDRIDAVKYAYSEYQDKIELISEIYKDEKLKPKEVENFYKENKEIVSYLYNSQSGLELQNFAKIKDYLLKKKKIRLSAKDEIASYFNNFDTPKDKINFYLFLKENKISNDDYQNYLKSGVVDISPAQKILNKSAVVEKLHSMKDWNEQKIDAFYKQNCEILTLGELMEQEKPDSFSLVMKFIEKFKLKDKNSFLNQYNTFYRAKEKKLTKQKALDFLELTKFIGNSNMMEEAQKKGVAPALILEERKELFENIQQDIQKFLDETDNELFVSMSALEVFNKFRPLFNTEVNVKTVLESISIFETENADLFNQQIRAIKPFEEYFDNKKELLAFFKANQIKLDNTKEDAQYRKMCERIISQIKENSNGDDEIYKKNLKNITLNKTLISSKNQYFMFESSILNNKDFPQIVEILCTKKVGDIKELVNFFDEMANEKGETSNIVSLLQENDIEVKQYEELIKKINDVSVKYGIKEKINNDNILNIDFNYYNHIEETPDNLNKLFSEILGKDCKCFLEYTVKGTTKEAKPFSSYEIITELFTRKDDTDNSYQNLKDVLGVNVEFRKSNAMYGYDYIGLTSKRLPEEFMKFFNSSDWHTLENGKIANVNIHTKLRAIGRFLINDDTVVQDLYSDKAKEKLKSLFNTIYCTVPNSIRETGNSSTRYIAEYTFEGEKIEVLFAQQGEIVTLYPKE